MIGLRAAIRVERKRVRVGSRGQQEVECESGVRAHVQDLAVPETGYALAQACSHIVA
jgi:hypothetical protein